MPPRTFLKAATFLYKRSVCDQNGNTYAQIYNENLKKRVLRRF